MKRCVAELTEGYVNIHADRLELDREGNMIYAWNSARIWSVRLIYTEVKR